MNFTVTSDKRVKIFTGIIILIFLTAIIGLIGIFIADSSTLTLAAAILLFAVFVVAYLFRPLSYTVTNDSLIIQRLAGNIHISKSSITEVRVIQKNEMNGSIRTFGVGGLFGYYGNFLHPKLGVMKWYVKRMDRLVLITTDSGKLLLSPDNVEGLINALH
jgi:hypothetical protein